MKRLLALLVLSFSLTACSTLGDIAVPFAEAIKDDTNPAGLTSADAAYLGAYRSYSNAIKGKKEDKKPIFELEAQDDKTPITISGVKSIRVYGPDQEVKITAPVKPKNFSDRMLDFAERAAELTFRYLLPIDLKKLDNEVETKRIEANTEIRKEELGITRDTVEAISETTRDVLDKVPSPE